MAGIQLTFEKNVQIKDLVAGNTYGEVYNETGDVVATLSSKVGGLGDKKSAWFVTNTVIKTSGTYKVVVNANNIVAGEWNAEANDGAGEFTATGELYAGGEFEFTVVKEPIVVTDPELPSGRTITKMYGDGYDFSNIIIKVKGVQELILDSEKVDDVQCVSADGQNVYKPETVMITGSAAWGWNVYIAYGYDLVFAPGEYTFTIPAGLATYEGGETPEYICEFTYAEPAAAVTTTVEVSNDGVVDSLGEFEMTFGEGLAGPVYFVVVTDENGNSYPFMPNNEGKYSIVDWGGVPAEPITAPGIYTLNLLDEQNAQSVFLSEGYTFAQSVFTWTIEEGNTTAIEAVDAEAENAEIYDITGRRVNEITKAGVYIVNGKKVLVK